MALWPYRKVVTRSSGMRVFVCETYKTNWQTESHFMITIFGTQLHSLHWYQLEHYFSSSLYERPRRHHQFGTQMLLGRFIGYVLNRGGGWTEDLIIADWHDTEHFAAPRVSRQKIQVPRNCRMHAVCFDGSMKQEGYAQRQTLRHQGVESFVVVGPRLCAR